MTDNQAIIANSMSEAELQSNVVGLARALGYLVHHQRPGMNKKGEWSSQIQGDAGFPDLVLAHSVRVNIIFLVELKLEKGKLTEAQERWREALSAYWRLWRPSDWLDGTIEKILGSSRHNC